MKKTSCLLFLLLTSVLLFNACSTDVDLYADYKDITVVYGLLDANQDTNYVKINKAFLGPGNALDIALIADSCNYPNKLAAKIIEYRAAANGTNYQKTRELILDTLTVHNKAQDGLFYAPDQLVYFTKEKINLNTEQYNYRYELEIDRGDTVLRATTNMVGGDNFTITTGSLNFSSDGQVKWRPCENASIYEVLIQFKYTEVWSNNDSVVRIMPWRLGIFPASSLEMEKEQYIVHFKSDMFYTTLKTYLGNDTLKNNVYRVIGSNPLCVSIAAGGEELYSFISVNGPSNSIVQTFQNTPMSKAAMAYFHHVH